MLSRRPDRLPHDSGPILVYSGGCGIQASGIGMREDRTLRVTVRA